MGGVRDGAPAETVMAQPPFPEDPAGPVETRPQPASSQSSCTCSLGLFGAGGWAHRIVVRSLDPGTRQSGIKPQSRHLLMNLITTLCLFPSLETERDWREE